MTTRARPIALGLRQNLAQLSLLVAVSALATSPCESAPNPRAVYSDALRGMT